MHRVPLLRTAVNTSVYSKKSYLNIFFVCNANSAGAVTKNYFVYSKWLSSCSKHGELQQKQYYLKIMKLIIPSPQDVDLEVVLVAFTLVGFTVAEF